MYVHTLARNKVAVSREQHAKGNKTKLNLGTEGTREILLVAVVVFK
jgi:hypothetical protein